MTHPCDVPTSVGRSVFPSTTLALSHDRIMFRTLVLALSFSKGTLWSMLSKHLAMSASRTNALSWFVAT